MKPTVSENQDWKLREIESADQAYERGKETAGDQAFFLRESGKSVDFPPLV